MLNKTTLFKFILFFGIFSAILIGSFNNNVCYAKANRKYAAIVVDAKSGAILYQRHANKRLHPASLTKMMTLFLTFEAIDSGKIRLNDRIFFSRNATRQPPSKLGLKRGESISVRHAILSLVTKSANDVSVAVAEAISGSEEEFARKMTRKARSLGMTNTTFVNPHGLHHSRQISTARDMAILSRALMQHYPHHYHYFSTASFSYNGHTYRNHNKLMKSYRGMDGLKTGYIAKSGFNLAASAVRDNRRLIGIVFGGRTASSRNKHMRKLLDDAFRNFGIGKQPPSTIVVHHKTPPIPAHKPAFGALAVAQAEIERNATGQGDIDIESTDNRIKNALTKEEQKMARIEPSSGGSQNWGIQVGAFKSRSATERVLNDTISKIGYIAQNSSPVITPLKTGNGLVFRARIVGMNSTQANHACRLLNDCLVITLR